MVGGRATAAAWMLASLLPCPTLLRLTTLRWYGEPLIAAAELPVPQSSCDAMCAPHASTALVWPGCMVNVTRTVRVEAAANGMAGAAPTYSTLVIVAPHMVILPGTCTTPAGSAAGSSGMSNWLVNGVAAAQMPLETHGSDDGTLVLCVVR